MWFFTTVKKICVYFICMYVGFSAQIITKMAKLALNKFSQIWDEGTFSPKGQLGTERYSLRVICI